jgi:hypothetical protein
MMNSTSITMLSIIALILNEMIHILMIILKHL